MSSCQGFSTLSACTTSEPGKCNAKNMVETFGLSSLVSSYYDEISLGQQRMVLLARAMVKSPRILILDEPCVGLDNYHRVLILWGDRPNFKTDRDSNNLRVSNENDAELY